MTSAREPCPCGSGKRFKACHGKESARAATTFVARPFEGLPNEESWVAMREILPAATMKATLSNKKRVTFTTLLPEQSAAMRTSSGELLIAMQSPTSSGDASRDIASAVEAAESLEPGEFLAAAPMGSTQRLQDIVTSVEKLALHSTFEYWELDPETTSHASEGIIPTQALDADGAFWCNFPDRRVVRWVITDSEDRTLDGLARLAALGENKCGEGSRYLGAFRADGLMIPVWEVSSDAQAVAAPFKALAKAASEAIKKSAPLTAEERRARAGLIGRNVTLR